MQRRRLFLIAIGLLTLALSALACNLGLDDNKQIIYVTSTAEQADSEINYTFVGEGGNIWSWQEGTLTCGTRDEMTITVTANAAKLVSRGACFFTRDTAAEPCESKNNDCAVILYGVFNPSTQKVTWNSCNSPGQSNASGEAVISGNKEAANGLQITGTGRCWFTPGTDQTHIFDFSLSQVANTTSP